MSKIDQASYNRIVVIAAEFERFMMASALVAQFVSSACGQLIRGNRPVRNDLIIEIPSPRSARSLLNDEVSELLDDPEWFGWQHEFRSVCLWIVTADAALEVLDQLLADLPADLSDLLNDGKRPWDLQFRIHSRVVLELIPDRWKRPLNSATLAGFLSRLDEVATVDGIPELEDIANAFIELKRLKRTLIAVVMRAAEAAKANQNLCDPGQDYQAEVFADPNRCFILKEMLRNEVISFVRKKPASEIVNRPNSGYKHAFTWLVKEGFLDRPEAPDGNERRRPKGYWLSELGRAAAKWLGENGAH